MFRRAPHPSFFEGWDAAVACVLGFHPAKYINIDSDESDREQFVDETEMEARIDRMLQS